MCVFNKRDPETSVNAIDSAINDSFGIENNDLIDLMKLRGIEGVNKINNSYGGIENLAKKLNTDLAYGLSGALEDLNKRVEVFGKNEIPIKSSKSFISLMVHALKEVTLIVLIICAVISIGLSFYHPPDDADSSEENPGSKDVNLEWIEGIAILIAVIVVVFVTAFNDWRKEKQFRSLQNRIEKDNLTSVIRNGKIMQINIKNLVVGDICCIKYGDLLAADGLIIHSSDLKVDESSLTGETDLVKKNEYDVSLLAGTHIMEGSGNYLVTAVGLNSQTGIIFKLLGTTKEKKKSKKDRKVKKDTPDSDAFENTEISTGNRTVLQMKLKSLSIKIGYIGILAAFLTFVILCLRLAIEEFYIKKNAWSNTYLKYISSFLVQAVTVVVVAVPEGLPLAVALSLAFAVRKMTQDNNLVRHLNACETMGSATTICSDKTGTLTTNRMTVVECFFGDELVAGVPPREKLSDEFKDLIFQSISINTNYTSKVETPKLPGELPQQLGNKTECALLGLVTQLGGNYEKIRSSHPTDSLIKVYTFNSARKMMTTVVKTSETGVYLLFAKGAPEIILDKCSFIRISKEDKIDSLNQVKRNKLIKDIVEAMGRHGLRTICVAYKEFRPKSLKLNDNSPLNIEYYDTIPDWNNEEVLINYMTCICILGIEDPVRIEVPSAIKKCQSSGIVVRMVTGDNINTATSIALKCGIIKPSDNFLIIESKEFNRRIRDTNNQVSQELIDKVWPRLRVLARSTPEDKYNLVNGIVQSKLSLNREVVAVTGDGTNDGPALKRADVGFAMGIQGTDVAKEASDIILTDDNFNSIVKAVLWGRNVYDSIAKFLQFQLTANFAAGLLSIICAATIKAVPLKAVQMLWVNLVMDTLASLALGTEKPNELLLRRKPYGRNKSMVSFEMCKFIVGHTIYQLAVVFILIYFAEQWLLIDSVVKYNDISKLKAPSQHFTLIFNVFVLMTLFNEINARKLYGERNVFEGIHKNPYFYVIWIICFVGQILIVNFGGIAFSVVPLDLDHWAWCMLFGVGSLLWGQILIAIPTLYLKRMFCLEKFSQNKENDLKLETKSVSQIDPNEDEIVASTMYNDNFKSSDVSYSTSLSDWNIIRF